MRFGSLDAANVNNLNVQREKQVCNQPSVTPPPQYLGTHHGGPQSSGEHEKLKEARRELLARHVVRVAAK